jgi:hypothetical protein
MSVTTIEACEPATDARCVAGALCGVPAYRVARGGSVVLACRAHVGDVAGNLAKQDAPVTGFLCKACGAAAPVGIGYAGSRMRVTPAADCPGPHA